MTRERVILSNANLCRSARAKAAVPPSGFAAWSLLRSLCAWCRTQLMGSARRRRSRRTRQERARACARRVLAKLGAAATDAAPITQRCNRPTTVHFNPVTRRRNGPVSSVAFCNSIRSRRILHNFPDVKRLRRDCGSSPTYDNLITILRAFPEAGLMAT
jgi:hypothetical protein